MAPADAAPVAFTAPADGLDAEIRVRHATGSATAVARRAWGLGVTAENITGEGWRLRVYRAGGGSGPGVVIVPGSTGLAAMTPMAALFASRGYAAGVLAYMQEPGLPVSFREIPVEAVEAGVRAFAALPEITGVGLVAVSVGTVAALSMLAAAEAPPVRAVVAVSPAHVVWQALGDGGPPPKASMLTRDGRELPYVPIHGERLLGQIARNRRVRAPPLVGAADASCLRRRARRHRRGRRRDDPGGTDRGADAGRGR